MEVRVILLLAIVFVSISIVMGSGNRQCSKPRPPHYGYIKSGRKNTYKIGNVVVFRCNRGYKLQGRSTIKCLRRGNSVYWNYKIPICKKIVAVPKVCKRLQDPNNGDVDLNGVRVGSKARYTCDKGFTLKGNSVRTCQRNGRWSGKAAFCQRKQTICQKLSDPRNGDVRLSGLRPGAKAKYSCDSGFRLRGNQVRKCQSNGQWSGSDAVCVKQTICQRLSDPKNGDVKLSGLKPGAKARYTCDRGFKLRGNQFRKCQSNGQWSGSDAVCVKIVILPVCPKLRDPDNGDVDLTGVRIGSKATYSCDDGFILTGNKVRNCQPNAQWSGSEPSCRRIVMCEELPDPQNGEVELSGTTVGSYARYECDDGFDLQGDKQRTCLPSGQWSGSEPICAEIIMCEELFDPDNGAVQLSGTDVGSSASYTCDDGFNLIGNQQRTCQPDGEWTGSDPFCEEIIMCEELFDPDNGVVQLSGTDVGSSASYTCNDGFNLIGNQQRTCQPDGEWTGSDPICEEIIMCEELFDPDNGAVDLSGTDVGSSASYTCDDGFDLIGNQQRICQPDGEWTGSDPICRKRIVKCENLDDPQYGTVQFPDVTVGSIATYTCNKGFQLDGNQQRTCQPNGQWSGSDPTCIAIPVQCKPLLAPKYGQVVISGLSIGSKARFSCDKGLIIKGYSVLTCLDGGYWSGKPPVCIIQDYHY